MYANDLAYHEGATEESYNRNSPELNVLQITWRMELLDQVTAILFFSLLIHCFFDKCSHSDDNWK